ncbi:hypothetical protein K2Q00_03110 [Patescibacteria group bacterium]|nr:hypothetical protein [Patescibacteria group bacterium]
MEYIGLGLLFFFIFRNRGRVLKTLGGAKLYDLPGIKNSGQIKEVIIAAIAVGFIFTGFSKLFPETTHAYVVQGGPVWIAAAAFVPLGASYLATNGRIQGWLMTIIGAVVVIWMLWFFVIALIHGTDLTRGEAARAVKQADAAQYIAQMQIATQQKAAEAAGGAQCLNVVHKDHVFGLQPDETSLVNNEGRCFFYFEPPPGTCFYAQGRWSDERKGPFGTCPTAIPFNATNAPRDPVRVWSAGPTPFTADYVLRPRTGTHGTVN